MWVFSVRSVMKWHQPDRGIVLCATVPSMSRAEVTKSHLHPGVTTFTQGSPSSPRGHHLHPGVTKSPLLKYQGVDIG
ncbi:hypothetical protein ACOMHN_022742 [Nucella lapillus]